jgi:hypothetical protein
VAWRLALVLWLRLQRLLVEFLLDTREAHVVIRIASAADPA